MKRRGVAIGAVAVLVLVLAFSVFLATRHAAPEASEFDSPLLGHAAPAISATTLTGQHVTLASERGKVVVLNFWASWCGPCQQEAPELSSFAWQERARVAVLGVVWEDDQSSALSFQRNYGSLYPSLVDPNGQIANDYGVTSPPTTFIINDRGVVSATLVGATTSRQLTTIVDRVERS